jgi:predicted lipoprotein with Yx(FWY)xxD motif
MRRAHVFILGALLSAASITTVASAQGGSPSARAARAARAANARAAHTAKVGLRRTSLGPILVSSSGRTLYEFTRDHPRANSCVKISGCSEIWPALTSSGKPTAGPGVRASLLSTIKLPGGARQVTYAGHALYLYSADSGPGETSYVGEKAFGGTWYAINSAGHTVK